jgi:hypothetical protein
MLITRLEFYQNVVVAYLLNLELGAANLSSYDLFWQNSLSLDTDLYYIAIYYAHNNLCEPLCVPKRIPANWQLASTYAKLLQFKRRERWDRRGNAEFFCYLFADNAFFV